MIELPTKRRLATRVNPNFMIMFGKPKCGKTTALSLLDNCLIIDLEKGAEFVDGLVMPVNDMRTLLEVAKQIKASGNPYKYIAIDTATKLEDEIILPLAKKLYMDTPMGKGFAGDDVRKLPQGAGYMYIRDAFKYVVDLFTPLCDTLILTAHCAEKMIEKDGKEMYEMELDLSGKLKRIISAKADAIGYVYRKKNQTFINFNGGDDLIIEARSEHLANKEFILTEKIDGKMVNYWNQIFI